MSQQLTDADLAGLVSAILHGDLPPDAVRALAAAIERASGAAPTYLPQAEAGRRFGVSAATVRGRVRRQADPIRTGYVAGRLHVHVGDLAADLRARPPRQTSSDQYGDDAADSAMLATLRNVQVAP